MLGTTALQGAIGGAATLPVVASPFLLRNTKYDTKKQKNTKKYARRGLLAGAAIGLAGAATLNRGAGSKLIYGVGGVPLSAATYSLLGAGVGSAKNKVQERKDKNRSVYSMYKKYKSM